MFCNPQPSGQINLFSVSDVSFFITSSTLAASFGSHCLCGILVDSDGRHSARKRHPVDAALPVISHSIYSKQEICFNTSLICLVFSEAVQAFLANVLCHIQISAAAMAVFALEIRTFSVDFGSAAAAYRTCIMLLNFQNDDAFLPCLVLELLPNGRNQSKGGIFSNACQNDISIVFVVFR